MDEYWACELVELAVDEEGVRDLAEPLRERGMSLRDGFGICRMVRELRRDNGAAVSIFGVFACPARIMVKRSYLWPRGCKIEGKQGAIQASRC